MAPLFRTAPTTQSTGSAGITSSAEGCFSSRDRLFFKVFSQTLDSLSCRGKLITSGLIAQMIVWQFSDATAFFGSSPQLETYTHAHTHTVAERILQGTCLVLWWLQTGGLESPNLPTNHLDMVHQLSALRTVGKLKMFSKQSLWFWSGAQLRLVRVIGWAVKQDAQHVGDSLSTGTQHFKNYDMDQTWDTNPHNWWRRERGRERERTHAIRQS